MWWLTYQSINSMRTCKITTSTATLADDNWFSPLACTRVIDSIEWINKIHTNNLLSGTQRGALVTSHEISLIILFYFFNKKWSKIKINKQERGRAGDTQSTYDPCLKLPRTVCNYTKIFMKCNSLQIEIYVNHVFMNWNSSLTYHTILSCYRG